MRRLAAVVLLLLSCADARAEVFHSRESALRLAFPGADRVEKRELFFSEAQARQAGQLARAPLPSRLVTVYVGWKDERPLGYAFLDTHKIRTLPETLMIVVGPEGRVAGVHVLAFHEPPEYASPAAWLRQFDGWALNQDLSLRGDIAGITGATLTSQSITAAVRRTLAVYQIGVAAGVSPADSTSTRATALGHH